MINKIASDAYSQGAYEALSQLTLPGHIKQAAAQYLVKTSALTSGPVRYTGPMANPVNLPELTKMEKAKMLLNKLPKGAGGRAALGAGVLGGLGLGAYGMGAFDDDDDFLSRAQEGDLSNAEIAALTGGTAALGAGGAYAAGLL